MVTLTIEQTCIRCGECISVCPAHILTQEGKQGAISISNLPTCIECGQCVAICPTDSVTHSTFPPETVHKVDESLLPSPDAVMELIRKRRSNRSFSDREVPMELLDRMLEAAHFAPTGANRQGLQYTLVTNERVLQEVTANSIKVIDRLLDEWKDSDNVVMLDMMRHLSSSYKKGTDLILRDAKALILIHSTDNASADANIAYQNASLMAESLKVGHFYTGYVFICSSMDKEGIIKKALGIEGDIYAGMALGMPKYFFKKYIDRKPMVVNKFL
ncbi:MAG: nitroreductase family protein [Prevotellaceae bacterium]|jgi:nitroreductase/NAD-dependent dihydropyrimidine dehydrogenase PreA subunit|nr:nitroreductase family protein [Prevotellaceae bacterium]